MVEGGINVIEDVVGGEAGLIPPAPLWKPTVYTQV